MDIKLDNMVEFRMDKQKILENEGRKEPPSLAEMVSELRHCLERIQPAKWGSFADIPLYFGGVVDQQRGKYEKRVLGGKTEATLDGFSRFTCIRCRNHMVLMAGEEEEEVFHEGYECPSCGSGREFVVRQASD